MKRKGLIEKLNELRDSRITMRDTYIQQGNYGVAASVNGYVHGIEAVIALLEEGDGVDLNELQVFANEACVKALEAGIEGAINWADLGCVTAERVEDNEGTITYRVWIEEAASDNWKFHQFISDYLESAGYSGVEVATNW